MKVQPVFRGKINVTIIKDDKWIWKNYKTTSQNDQKISQTADTVCPNAYTWNRQYISDEEGKNFINIVEQSINKKIDIPKDCSYSVTRSKSYSYLKRRPVESILLFCEEKLSKDGKSPGDRTAIDIYL